MSRSLIFALGVAIGLLAAYLVWGDRIAIARPAMVDVRNAPTSTIVSVKNRYGPPDWRDLEAVDSV
jgi:hypothetical protein